MASWKALGWILEAPELDFRASKPQFWSLQPRFWSLQARLWSLQASNLPLLMLPTFSNTTWQMWDSLLPGVHSFCVFAFLNSLAKVWEAAVSPLGGLQSAGHRRCANSVLDWFPTGSVQSQLANLTFFRAVRSRNSIWSVLSPILSFPQEPGDHRKPDAKKRKSLVFSHFWSIFSPSEPRLKNDIEKTSKKVRKSRILAFPTPPKTKPKSCLFGKRRFLKNRAPA